MPHGFKNWRLIVRDLYQSYILLSNSASVLAKGEGWACTISAGSWSEQTAGILFSSFASASPRLWSKNPCACPQGARFQNVPTVKPFFQLVPSKETVVIRIEHP